MKKMIGIGAAAVALALSLYPAVSIGAAREALTLCAGTLIPSLFPFFVCANLLIAGGLTASAGRFFEKPARLLFRVGGEGATAVLLGLVSGYPAGAAVTCRLYAAGSISRAEAQRLLAFTNNAGPLFIIGAVGTAVYGNPRIGYLLLAAQTLATLCTGFCMRFYGTDMPLSRTASRRPAADPMGDAVHTVLSLCGFVVFFSVIAAFLEHLGLLGCVRRLLSYAGLDSKTAALLAAGSLEISSAAQCSGGALPAMAALLSFGGFSVLLQTASLTKKAGLSMKSYALGKLLSAGLAAFFCRLLLSVFPVTIPVSTPSFRMKTAVYAGYLGAFALLSAAIVLFLLLLAAVNKRLPSGVHYGTIKKKAKRIHK